MDAITIKKLDGPPNDATEYADFIMASLLDTGVGVVEADSTQHHDNQIDWTFRSRLTGESRVLFTCPTYAFRPALASIGFRFVNNPYVGQAVFNIQFENEATKRPEGFCIYLCNEPAMAIWIRIYFHSIPGQWPMPEAFKRNSTSDPA